MNCPCKLCKKHSETCHANCKEYKQYQKELAEINKKKKAYEKLYAPMSAYPKTKKRKPTGQVD